MEAEQVIQLIQHEMNKVQGVSKKMLFNEIGTPGGPKTILRVGDHSKMGPSFKIANWDFSPYNHLELTKLPIIQESWRFDAIIGKDVSYIFNK